MIEKSKVEEILSSVVYPESGKSIAAEGILSSISISGEAIVDIELAFVKSTDPFINAVKRSVRTALEQEYGADVRVNISTVVQPKREPDDENFAIKDVKNIVAVASGKGGVGKSSVTVNLAMALALQGYKVGIIDADIFGPSIPKMFGIEDQKPTVVTDNGRELIMPIERFGIKILSIGFFVDPDNAVVWRGPMAGNMLKQLIQGAKWGNLDFLLFDMPPGTSDIHLTLVQTIPVTGAVIVTTPQDVALVDARKGIEMFRLESVNVPVLGLVENMSWFTPEELPNNKYFIFGKGGAQKLANITGTVVLAQIPLVAAICESGDNGKPVAADPTTILGKAFANLADKFVSAINDRNTFLPPSEKVKMNKK